MNKKTKNNLLEKDKLIKSHYNMAKLIILIFSLSIVLVACDSQAEIKDKTESENINAKVEDIENYINELSIENPEIIDRNLDNDENIESETLSEIHIDVNDSDVSIKNISDYPLIKTEVIRVVDGDTIKVNISGEVESLRLIGVDTPESVHPKKEKNVPEGKIASDYVKNLIEGEDVYVEFDVEERDRYGRYLAYIYLEDGEMLNNKLVKEGYAQLSTYPPNVRYVDMFKESARIARDSGVGFYESNGLFDEGSVKAENSTINSLEGDSKANVTGKIKGNTNSKIYHVPGGEYYDSVSESNTIWFDTEAEAQQAGYRRAKK